MLGRYRSDHLFPSLLLYDTADSSPGETATVPVTEVGEREEDVLCSLCGTVITSRRDEIRVMDSFEHVFTNPAGFVYRIGCFRQAPGCLEQGERTNFFSWFPGFSWSFALCGRCRTHLGWRYSGGGGESFFGLILDRLTGC